MADPNDLTTTIQDVATAPLKIETEAGKVEERAAADLIELDRYLAAKAAAARPGRGLRFGVLRNPGAVSGVNDQSVT